MMGFHYVRRAGSRAVSYEAVRWEKLRLQRRGDVGVEHHDESDDGGQQDTVLQRKAEQAAFSC